MIPIYRETFSRDFTLASMEVWWRGEVQNDKGWTLERQPFLPYIIFERKGGIVYSFYDPRGISWIKNLLLDRVKNDPNFLNYLENHFMSSLYDVRAFYGKKSKLDHKELCEFLKIFEQGYVWLEAAWWLWFMTKEELGETILPKHFLKLREETQDYVPKSENLIRESLLAIYPELSDFIEVLRIDEIKKNSFPNEAELQKRLDGYFFVNNQIYVEVSRDFIEKKYKIKFETIDVKDTKELKGEVAYHGKIQGSVKLVLSVKQLEKIKDGDVLVSLMTLPDFLPAIKKASAIITDEGGLLCHAAIISRELKKPCLIGTKIATKVLKDGMLVEVDANNGVVRIIK